MSRRLDIKLLSGGALIVEDAGRGEVRVAMTTVTMHTLGPGHVALTSSLTWDSAIALAEWLAETPPEGN